MMWTHFILMLQTKYKDFMNARQSICLLSGVYNWIISKENTNARQLYMCVMDASTAPR